MAQRLISLPPLGDAPGIEIDSDQVSTLDIRSMFINMVQMKNGGQPIKLTVDFNMKLVAENSTVVIEGTANGVQAAYSASRTRDAVPFLTSIAKEAQVNFSLLAAETMQTVLHEIMQDISMQIPDCLPLDLPLSGTGVMLANNEPVGYFTELRAKENDDGKLEVYINNCSKFYDLNDVISPRFEFYTKNGMMVFKPANKAEMYSTQDGDLAFYDFPAKGTFVDTDEKGPDIPTLDKKNPEEFVDACNTLINGLKDHEEQRNIFDDDFSLI